MADIERCGHSVGLGDALCHRRVAHRGHCATGGSYAQALDELDQVRDQLEGAVEALERIAEDRVPGMWRVPSVVQAYAQGVLTRLGGR